MLNGESSRAENISCAGRFGALPLFNAASAVCSRRQVTGDSVQARTIIIHRPSRPGRIIIKT